jgi:hypothetical protein
VSPNDTLPGEWGLSACGGLGLIEIFMTMDSVISPTCYPGGETVLKPRAPCPVEYEVGVCELMG